MCIYILESVSVHDVEWDMPLCINSMHVYISIGKSICLVYRALQVQILPEAGYCCIYGVSRSLDIQM